MDYNPFSLVNKTILITGASSGIGKSAAIECSKLGATVIITGRNESRLKETYDLLAGEGHSLFALDLCNTSEVDKFIESLPLIDGLVNNAGIWSTFPCKFINKEKMDEMYKVNVEAPILLFCKLIKMKKIKKGASVVFTSSINGPLISFPGSGLYSVTKSALIGFVKTAAIENAPKGIRVNCVCPGMVETELYRDGNITEEQSELDRKKYPLGRYGKVEEVAWAMIYLLSDASQFVTGSNLVIDGGYTIQ